MIDPKIEQKIKDRIVAEYLNIFPQQVVIESITNCNLNCVMCARKHITREYGQISWPLYIKVVEEMAQKANTSRLWLCFFGEPLLRKDLPDMVLFAKERGLKNVAINSNMNVMNDTKAEVLIKNGLNSIYVGLDAATSDVYDQIRRGGNYETVVNNVIKYKELLDKYGNSEQQIIVQFVEIEQNSGQRQAFIDFWKKYGITTKIRPVFTFLNSNDVKLDTSKIERQPCFWALNIMPIGPFGEFVHCGVDYNGKKEYGNLNNSSIEEIWNTTKKEQRLIQLNCQWDKLPDFCRNCPDWAASYVEYNNA